MDDIQKLYPENVSFKYLSYISIPNLNRFSITVPNYFKSLLSFQISIVLLQKMFGFSEDPRDPIFALLLVAFIRTLVKSFHNLARFSSIVLGDKLESP